MNDTMRQRAWLVVVLVLVTLNATQYVTTRNLRAELVKSRVDMERRAGQLVERTLRERRHEMVETGQWLQEYYRSDEGLQRSEGLWIRGGPDWEGIAAWLFDTYLGARFAGASESEARQKVVDAIERSEEWQRKHPIGSNRSE